MTTSDFLGKSYPYAENIRSPAEIGMSDRGTIGQLGRNVRGFIDYVEVLISGDSKASATGGPLGNRYFLKTGAVCLAKDTCDSNGENCKETDRYIYVNNIPTGNIPFISSGAGMNFKNFRGLIPGSLENLNVLNPMAIFRAFRDGASPKCQIITMETVDNNNVRSEESHYVTLGDIKSMNPCLFNTATHNRTNPVTNQKCRQAFQNIESEDTTEVSILEDPIDQLFFAGVSCIGVYIFYRMMVKSK
jgi:hypothetical protein